MYIFLSIVPNTFGGTFGSSTYNMYEHESLFTYRTVMLRGAYVLKFLLHISIEHIWTM
jgi:hypothetical protein